MSNAMPLSRPQRSALLHATARELGWGLQAVSDELSEWRKLAAAIPDRALRDDALHALDAKRGHSDGAGLFSILPTVRHPQLLRLLIAYEVIYDYLDNVSERAAGEFGTSNARLYGALTDALDAERPADDYYSGLPWRDDGGYLGALVEVCRAGCRLLPRFDVVKPLIEHEVSHFTVLAINHDCDSATRDAMLERWAADEFGEESHMIWYELTAAASQSIVTLALLALAADPRTTAADAQATRDAYFPWFAYVVTMLDSYADQAEDRASGAHSYVGHYPTHEEAARRLSESVERSAVRVLRLPNGERHAVLLGCAVAMYLSKNSAWTPGLRASTWRICRSGGTLTTILLPILRIWRICNRQSSAT